MAHYEEKRIAKRSERLSTGTVSLFILSVASKKDGLHCMQIDNREHVGEYAEPTGPYRTMTMFSIPMCDSPAPSRGPSYAESQPQLRAEVVRVSPLSPSKTF